MDARLEPDEGKDARLAPLEFEQLRERQYPLHIKIVADGLAVLDWSAP